MRVFSWTSVSGRAAIAAMGLVVACSSSPTRGDDERRLSSLDRLHQELVDASGHGDSPGLHEAWLAARRSVESRGGSQGFVDGAEQMLDAARIGHTGLYAENTCFGQPFVRDWNPFGVRAVPIRAGFLVTSNPKNALGLHVGDIIVTINSAQGREAMVDLVFHRAFCGSVAPSSSGRDAMAARIWSGILREGDSLEWIDSSAVSHHQVVLAIPPRDPTDVSATPALPTATTRADSVTVLRVPSFEISNDDVTVAVNAVAAAKALVIDVRGNFGGYPAPASLLAAALPNAARAGVFRCTSPYKVNEIEAPRGTLSLPNVPIVVLMDGLSYSATSHFIRFAAEGARAKLVGLPDAAGYGNSMDLLNLEGPPQITVTINKEQCFDLATGKYLEGDPVPLDRVVEMSATDVASGVDTQLESAAELVRSQLQP